MEISYAYGQKSIEISWKSGEISKKWKSEIRLPCVCRFSAPYSSVHYSKLQGQPCCGARTRESLAPAGRPHRGAVLPDQVCTHNTMLRVLHKTKTTGVGPCSLSLGLGIGLLRWKCQDSSQRCTRNKKLVENHLGLLPPSQPTTQLEPHVIERSLEKSISENKNDHTTNSVTLQAHK